MAVQVGPTGNQRKRGETGKAEISCMGIILKENYFHKQK